MANTRRKCSGCEQTWTFPLEDAEDGAQVIWECPDYECATRNIIEGKTPAEMALERVMPTEEARAAGAVHVTDSDEGTTADTNP